MGLFIFRFWPVLIPLLIYWLWLWRVGKKAVAAGEPKPKFRDGPWYWAVLASLLVGLVCFILLGLGIEPQKGEYIPPHIENGVLKEGEIQP